MCISESGSTGWRALFYTCIYEFVITHVQHMCTCAIFVTDFIIQECCLCLWWRYACDFIWTHQRVNVCGTTYENIYTRICACMQARTICELNEYIINAFTQWHSGFEKQTNNIYIYYIYNMVLRCNCAVAADTLTPLHARWCTFFF